MTTKIEERLEEAREKRDRLLNKRAEFKARRSAAKEELENLSKKAGEKGFDLDDLPALLEKTKSDLEEKLSEFEQALETASDAISEYEQKE